MSAFKVQVMLSPDMVTKVDFYAKKIGVSRSALCAFFIGQGVMSYDVSMNLISALADRFDLPDEVISALSSSLLSGSGSDSSSGID